jgi:isoleucyl-tRNA synthetase
MEKFGLEEQVVERLKGKNVLGNGVEEVIGLLKERGTLLREVEVQHKFPYDWRTKKPVIFRSVVSDLFSRSQARTDRKP